MLKALIANPVARPRNLNGGRFSSDKCSYEIPKTRWKVNLHTTIPNMSLMIDYGNIPLPNLCIKGKQLYLPYRRSQYDNEIAPLGQIAADGSCAHSFPMSRYGREFRIANTEEALAIVNYLNIAYATSFYFREEEINTYWGFSHTIQTLNTSDGYISKPFSSSAAWIIGPSYDGFYKNYPSFCVSKD